MRAPRKFKSSKAHSQFNKTRIRLSTEHLQTWSKRMQAWRMLLLHTIWAFSVPSKSSSIWCSKYKVFAFKLVRSSPISRKAIWRMKWLWNRERNWKRNYAWNWNQVLLTQKNSNNSWDNTRQNTKMFATNFRKLGKFNSISNRTLITRSKRWLRTVTSVRITIERLQSSKQWDKGEGKSSKGRRALHREAITTTQITCLQS